MSQRDLLGIAILACYLLETSSSDEDEEEEADAESNDDKLVDTATDSVPSVPNNSRPKKRQYGLESGHISLNPTKKRKLSPNYSTEETSDDEYDPTNNKLLAKSSRPDDPTPPLKHKSRRVWCLNPNDRDKEICANFLLELSSDLPELNRNFLCMSADQFDHLLALVKPHIEKSNTSMRECIPASDRLVLTLRYLATGDSYRSMNKLFSIPQPTISTIIPRVLEAIYKVLAEDYIKLPESESEWESVADQFNEKWKLPNCIGALGGRHIVLAAPHNPASVFCNYKGSQSVIILGIAEADHKFIYVDVGRNANNGSSDGDELSRCTFGMAMDSHQQLPLPQPKPLNNRQLPIPYVLAADDSCTQRPNVIKPFPLSNPRNPLQTVFNVRLNQAHQTIDNVFGHMAHRFRVLQNPVRYDPEKTKKVGLACCALHNYLISTNRERYAPAGSFDEYDGNGTAISLGEWRSMGEKNGLIPLEAMPEEESSVALADDEVLNEFMLHFNDAVKKENEH